MPEVIRKTRRERVSILSLANPPVNGLSHQLRSELASALEEGTADDDILAFVIIGVGKMFSAGADIREFGTGLAAEKPTLPRLIDAIENCPKPVVAAIHGVAAGGGFELALGCHARLATTGAKIGLPEVSLGIIPGAGGTQRLPRVIGIEQAAARIVEGKLFPSSTALELGAIDELIEGPILDLQLRAIEKAKSLTSSPLRTTRDRPHPSKPDDANQARLALSALRKKIEKKSRGFEAPFAALDVMEASLSRSFAESVAHERQVFQRLVGSPQSAALRHVFFAERQLSRIPGIPKHVQAATIRKVAVIGCGTMGAGIAMCFADAGIPVAVIETAKPALDKGWERIKSNYASSVSKGRIDEAEAQRRLSRISVHLDDSPLTDVDLVVEAVFEDMEIKKEVFARLEKACPPHTILATNTSTMDIDEIARATSSPSRVIGTHFFSPAHVMKLMENVRGEATSDEVVATIMALAKRLGKVGVLVGVCDGFVGNRMLYAYRRQADFLIEEGAQPQDVDRVMRDFGLPMGPFAMADLAGLDIGWSVRKRQAASRPPHLRYSPIADRICELGRFGQKTGAGWYRYESGSRTPIPDPVVENVIKQTASELGIVQRMITDEEIEQRCVYALVNEGAKILDEGIAIRSSDIDMIWIYGYGFPRYRGGPMFYADQIGLGQVQDTLTRFHEEQGEWMKPAPLIQRLVDAGQGFDDFSREG